MIKFSLFLILAGFLTPDLHAYLDPGSGSAALYALIGIFVTLLYSLKGLFLRIYYYISGKSAEKGLSGSDLILHSEGVQYDHLFLPLLWELSSRGIEITYITQYERPSEAPSLPGNITHHVLPSGPMGFAALNRVKARIFVTTTPQLDVMMFKRSPQVKHYSHLFHAPTDIAPYKPFAFDFFDSVLCPGPSMMESLRHIEKIRNLSPKKLYETGVVYYDAMAAEKPPSPKAPAEKKVVLIAPSWGENGLFTRCGFDFLAPLREEFRLILRPHPQMAISQKELFKELLKKCEELGLTLDRNPQAQESMAASHVMLSDFSGVIYDYAYLYEKPVVVLDTHLDFEGFEGRHLPHPLWQDRMRKKIGKILPLENISECAVFIKEALGETPGSIAAHRDENLFNFGKAVPAAAGQIEELLQGNI